MNTLEFWNNSEIPDIALSSVFVDFDRVKYQIETTSTIQIKNTGATISHWHFVPKVSITYSHLYLYSFLILTN
jgi:hypothetical protein